MDPGSAHPAEAAGDVVSECVLRTSPFEPALPPRMSLPRPVQGANLRAVHPPQPTPDQLVAWRAFLHAHATVVRRLDGDLAEAHGLPLNMYDVLVQLVEASDHRLRMTDLARAVLLSRSGITRLVDRMAREGYVRREQDPADARGVWAVLTDSGYDALRTASGTHLQGVARYVVDLLSPDELAALGRACAKIVADGD